jgi:hypothetical protein
LDTLIKQNPEIKGKEWLGLFGAVSMIQFEEALKRTGRDLNSDTFIKAVETMKDWKPEGMGAGVVYGPDRHHGVNGFRMGQAKDGKIIQLETEFHLAKPRF